ncbi:MAG: hypothetical protein L3J16_07695 [Anaerolineales bacterium]|nr:hypothetical protein [Anaerolineales bacterium]
MRRSNIELWLAFFAMLLIAVVYAAVIFFTKEIPAAGELFGHSLGILGFVLMLMTETLYSLRKRSRGSRWGKMSNWLKFHIFTGLVGPFMVLLHTSWKFNGLAGAVTLLTLIVVISGVIGRYIYTAIPRTADGTEIQMAELEQQIAAADAKIDEWTVTQPQLASALKHQLASLPDTTNSGPMAVFGRFLIEWEFKRAWKREKRQLAAQARPQIAQIEKLVRRKQALTRQVNSLAMARRLLAVWHTVHIPIGMALFTAAFLHISGAIYFATLLR